MKNKCAKTAFDLAYLLLTACFIVAMFSCGDADCLAGGSNEDCASLLCSLLNKHGASAHHPGGDSSKDCSCVCHMPAIVHCSFEFAYLPIAQKSTLIAFFSPSSAPNRPVYHPPPAA